MGLPKVGDTINLAEMFVSHGKGTRIDVSQGLCFGEEVFVVWVAEVFVPGARKPFLRLAGHKGETPADLFRQLADIYDQEDVTVKGKAGALAGSGAGSVTGEEPLQGGG